MKKDYIFNLPASFIYFIAGIVASAAVNNISGLVSMTDISEKWILIVSAIAWLICSFSITIVGQNVEEANKRASIVEDPSFSSAERAEVIAKIRSEFRKSVRLSLVAIALYFLLGGWLFFLVAQE